MSEYDGLTPEEMNDMLARHYNGPLFTPPHEQFPEVDLGEATSLANWQKENEGHGWLNPDWVIPDFLERKDKLLVTGPSGHGKSTLLRQIGLMAASGTHPFDCEGFEPIKVLVMDFENRPSQTYRAMHRMTLRLRTQLQYDEKAIGEALRNYHIYVREGGLDLNVPGNTNKLIDFVSKVQPDLLIIGPLYYLGGASNDEQSAFVVSQALRSITVEQNCAIICEAHSAKTPGSEKPRIDPQGSNVWIKFPDYGRGLMPTDEKGIYKFDYFRGDREPRNAMPEYLRLNWTGATMPWTVHYPELEEE